MLPTRFLVPTLHTTATKQKAAGSGTPSKQVHSIQVLISSHIIMNLPIQIDNTSSLPASHRHMLERRDQCSTPLKPTCFSHKCSLFQASIPIPVQNLIDFFGRGYKVKCRTNHRPRSYVGRTIIGQRRAPCYQGRPLIRLSGGAGLLKRPFDASTSISASGISVNTIRDWMSRSLRHAPAQRESKESITRWSSLCIWTQY